VIKLIIIICGIIIVGYALLCWNDNFNPFKNWKEKKKLQDETDRAIAHHEPGYPSMKKKYR